jgi:hypothetical protein
MTQQTGITNKIIICMRIGNISILCEHRVGLHWQIPENLSPTTAQFSSDYLRIGRIGLTTMAAILDADYNQPKK